MIQKYSIQDVKHFSHAVRVLYEMDLEDGSMEMISEWQKGAFKKIPKGYEHEPVVTVDLDSIK